MDKSVGNLIKNIRRVNNLTQSQFAKKFFITEKTVSNYENGIRTPDINFLKRVCDEFFVTLDYFIGTTHDKSCPRDLIVSERNGKYAIYDKKQSYYLTPHLYDKIILSKFNYHVLLKGNNLINKSENSKRRVTYSAIIDNYGNIKETPHLIDFFKPYNMFDVVTARRKTDNKACLVNSDGETLSSPYDLILAVDGWNDFGLSFGIDFEKNPNNHRPMVKSRKLMDKTGKEIEVEFSDINSNAECKAKNLNDIGVVLEYIKLYGPNIIKITPIEIFKTASSYPMIIKAVCEYSVENKVEGNMSSFTSYAISSLMENALLFKPDKSTCKVEYDDEAIYSDNTIENNFLKKKVLELFKILGVN